MPLGERCHGRLRALVAKGALAWLVEWRRRQRRAATTPVATGGFMTYSPGSPGYPPAQQPGSYGAASSAPASTEPGESKLGLYLAIAVTALGLLAYFFSFGPLFTYKSDIGGIGADVSGDTGFAVPVAVLAALIAGVGLLPKVTSRLAPVAVLSVLAVLMIISTTFSKPDSFSTGWALWVVLVCIV